MTCCWLAEPAVDGSGLPDVEEEGTDLQRGVKVAGIAPWIHHTRAKKAYHNHPEGPHRPTGNQDHSEEEDDGDSCCSASPMQF